MGGLSLNLPEQLAFYGSYHNHPLNQLIHFFCVPAILWSIFVWFAPLGPLLPGATPPPPAWLPPAWAAALQPTNPAFLLVGVYASFYLLLDVFAGASWAVMMGLPLAWSAVGFAIYGSVGGMPAWAVAAGVQAVAWYMQIHPGHAILEGRKPALMDSLVQAFALAPLFVWFELLFLLGYRPGLRAQLSSRVAQLVAEHNAQRQPLMGGGEGQGVGRGK